MKIWLRNIPGARVGGPFSFVGVLMAWLRARGDTVTYDSSECGIDVALAVNTIESNDLRCLKWRKVPIVMRVDGVPFNVPGMNFEHETARIHRCYDVADAVVFQSEFSRQIVQRSFGPVECEHRVITNGVDLNLFDRAKGDEEPLALTIVCASVWRPQKRLSAIVRGFLCFHERYSDSRLLVIGSTERAGADLPQHPSVNYLGSLPHEQAAKRLGEGDIFMHLAWLDWCPNVVIEAQAMGMPVICASAGGTREILVHGTGQVLKTDPSDIPSPSTNIYDPKVIPEIPEADIAVAIESLAKNLSAQKTTLAEAREELGIERAGKAYRDMFEGLCSGAIKRPTGRGFWSLAFESVRRRLPGGVQKGCCL